MLSPFSREVAGGAAYRRPHFGHVFIVLTSNFYGVMSGNLGFSSPCIEGVVARFPVILPSQPIFSNPVPKGHRFDSVCVHMAL